MPAYWVPFGLLQSVALTRTLLKWRTWKDRPSQEMMTRSYAVLDETDRCRPMPFVQASDPVACRSVPSDNDSALKVHDQAVTSTTVQDKQSSTTRRGFLRSVVRRR